MLWEENTKKPKQNTIMFSLAISLQLKRSRISLKLHRALSLELERFDGA
jgi:hypothetical protein